MVVLMNCGDLLGDLRAVPLGGATAVGEVFKGTTEAAALACLGAARGAALAGCGATEAAALVG